MRFNQEIADEFLLAIRAGASNEVAANHAETPIELIREWLKGGTPAKEKFRMDVDKARSDIELLAVGHVRRRMTDDPQAAQWVADKVRGDAELERLRRLTT
jgi:hypothetical protein